MIQIPLEIGDTILTGGFKVKGNTKCNQNLKFLKT